MHYLNLTVLPLLAATLFAQGTPEVEPNDFPSVATTLALGRQGDGAISFAGDSDLWKITLTTNCDLRFWVNPGVGTSIANSDLALLAADGTTELTFNDDATSPASWLSAIATSNLAAGDYYLRIRSSQSFDPNGTGSYTLDVVGAPLGTYFVTGGSSPGIPTPVNERAENNDPRQPGGVATPSFENSLILGSTAAATSGTSFTDPLADYDFYQINVTRPGLLTMETLPTAAFPAMRDTVVWITDSLLQPLAADDDSGFGLFSRLTHYVIPRTYYVVVKGKNPGNYANPGNYVLEILMTPQAPPGGASVTVHAGGCGPSLGVRQTVAGPVARTEVPVLGSGFYVNGGNMQPNTLVLHIIGVEVLSAPYNMGPIGAPGCVLEVEPIDQSLGVANAQGVDYWVLHSPVQLPLIGLPLEQQIAIVDLPANPLGLRISNRVSSVCGIYN